MFTGIIEGLGTLVQRQHAGAGARLVVEAPFSLSRTRIGDSIAVNGACLTVVHLEGTRFSVDVSPETLSRTTLGSTRIGERMNVERALRLGDRLDGHLVTGHVDGIGTISARRPQDNAIIVTIDIPESLGRYLISKGSVAVDGTSLTINACHRASFSVSIIPHTASLSTIGFKQAGQSVNIETDMIGKYVEKLLTHGRASTQQAPDQGTGIDAAFLRKTGFI